VSAPQSTSRHEVLIIGGGSAGIPVAARLRRAGARNVDTMKPRYDMWLLKRYGLPAMYWHGVLRGRV
jgi:cation diffusion facilitator CzcD-associated flavoprotein CzcO